MLESGYYKGVDASNVKTKKDLNENCHIWANLLKNSQKTLPTNDDFYALQLCF